MNSGVADFVGFIYPCAAHPDRLHSEKCSPLFSLENRRNSTKLFDNKALEFFGTPSVGKLMATK